MRLVSRLVSDRLFRLSLGSLSVRVLSAISAILLNLVISRSLELSAAGYFFLGLAIINFIGPLSRLGLDRVVIRLIGGAEGVGFSASVIRRSFLITAVSSGIFSISLYMNSDRLSRIVFSKPEFSSVLEVFSVSLFFLLGMRYFCHVYARASENYIVSVFLGDGGKFFANNYFGNV